MKKSVIVSVITALLIILWIYASVSKLLTEGPGRLQMLNQILPASVSELIFWLLCITELVTALLLMVNMTRSIGLLISVMLMAVFTIYIGLVVSGAFKYTPCSCGGIIGELSWMQHLVFNIIFLVLALYAHIHTLKSEGLWERK